MSSISVNRSTKTEFDELKPDEDTHDEFVQDLLDAYRRDNGEIINVEEIVEEIKMQIASEVELASFRGTQEALEEYHK